VGHLACSFTGAPQPLNLKREKSGDSDKSKPNLGGMSNMDVFYSLELKKSKGRGHHYLVGYDLITPDIVPAPTISGHIRPSDRLRSDMPTKIFPTRVCDLRSGSDGAVHEHDVRGRRGRSKRRGGEEAG
jgi:hypothetical protein